MAARHWDRHADMTDTNDQVYRIGELAEAAGVTPRTIRYYTAEGLLPPPDSRGAYALYSADHLRRLKLIARLKEAYLPLSEIRAILSGLTPDEVEALLAQHEHTPAAPSSASDYVAQVLAERSGPRAIAEGRAGYTGRAQLPSQPAAPPLQTPRHMVGASSHGGDFFNALRVGRAEPAPSQPPEVAQRSEEQPGLLGRILPRRRPAGERREDAAVEERWRRVTFAPGVELHIRDPLPERLQERVRQLLERAGELFAE